MEIQKTKTKNTKISTLNNFFSINFILVLLCADCSKGCDFVLCIVDTEMKLRLCISFTGVDNDSQYRSERERKRGGGEKRRNDTTVDFNFYFLSCPISAIYLSWKE